MALTANNSFFSLAGSRSCRLEHPLSLWFGDCATCTPLSRFQRVTSGVT